ncbi:LysR family transcriptional regulator, partial [Streptosporangium minutum]
FHYGGEDLHTVLNLAAAGHGLTLLPSSVAAGVPLTAPRVVHRVEMLHGPLASGPARAVAERLG